MNFIAEVSGVLTGIGVDQDTIDTIKGVLYTNQELLHEDQPTTSTVGAFGRSAAGADLDTQTATAHEHVVEALKEMIKGLGIYSQNLTTFMQGMDDTDTEQQELYGTVRQSVQAAGHYLNHHDFHDHQDGA
ncbi:hypothetical protein [Nocardioides mangrovi]|uniref:Uncharacterized protein n=1 Tax=Nocardioides mangrovi TaxID=2874580 RepID=A0ABS7UBV7_9ACTN|nr:hypothetical protein [Nocardioides mangrovi]MBZ5738461.1 hypothetical protein [Nocardioides mangrovi]